MSKKHSPQGTIPTDQDILAEYAEGLAAGGISPEALILKYGLAENSEIAQLLRLAAEIEQVLVRVAPSDVFVAQLRDELMAVKSQTLLTWLRQLNTMYVAAGIGSVTMAAGIFWLASRNPALEKWRRKNGLLPILDEAEKPTAIAS